MRDATSQDSQGFELARAQEFLFHLLALLDLRSQTLGGLLQFCRPRLYSQLELLIEGFRVAFGSLQVLDENLVFESQMQ